MLVVLAIAGWVVFCMSFDEPLPTALLYVTAALLIWALVMILQFNV